MKNKKIGIALGSGGFRGIAHIGVLKVLEKNDLKPDYITGSSIGSIIGAYYAIYGNCEKIEERMKEWPIDNLYKFLDLSWKGGLIAGKKFSKFLDKEFGGQVIGRTKIPLKIIATDLISGKPYVFDSGDLAKAIRASVSVPLMFSPVKQNDHLLVDGALSNPVPLNYLEEFEPDILIGVNLYHKNEFVKRNFNAKNIVLRSTRISLFNLAKADIKDADVVIAPDTSDIISDSSLSKYNWESIEKLIKIGEDEANKKLPELKKLFSK
ncbi:MAG: patatin-like phospholipase family protein [Patescibacteria group bacterium]|jgi:NTE family protein|nr:patatin-like phospholipase family protein [Patescibacteria group bacterium]